MARSSTLPLSEMVDNRTERLFASKNADLPYVALEHIDSGTPRLIGIGNASESVSTNTRFSAGDVLFGKLRPYLRKCVQVDFDGCCSTEILVLRTKNGNSARFVAKVFQNDTVFNEATRVSFGTKMPRASWSDLRLFKVFCPEESEQSRIAEILDTVDEAILRTEQIIEKLKLVKQGLLHDLLTRGIDGNSELRDPIRNPKQFKDSLLGIIPKGWDARTINEMAVHVGSGITPRGGSEVYLSDGVVFVRSQDVTVDGLDLSDVAYISEAVHTRMNASEIFAHDVLINITGASIGRCCPVPENLGKANVNQHVCAIRLEHPSAADAKLLAAILSSPIGQHQVFRLNAGGNRQGLNYQQLRSFRIPWPSDDHERINIAEIVGAQERRITTEIELLNKFRLTKLGLMDDLLSGRVRVKV